MTKRLLLFIVLTVIIITQPAVSQIFKGTDASRQIPGAQLVRFSEGCELPTYIKLKQGDEIDYKDFEIWIRKTFDLPSNYGFLLMRSFKDQIGDIHYRYQETIHGIPVHNGQFILHTRNDLIYSINGNLFNSLNVQTNPAITEEEALKSALSSVNADLYKWDIPSEEKLLKDITGNPDASYFPDGVLTIVPVQGNIYSKDYHLTYKFNIYAHAPMSRANIFVDAFTGEVVFNIDQIHVADSTGSAHTKYSDTVAIISDYNSGSFRLRESGRGNGIETYDMNTGTNYGSAVDFIDTDNFWNNFNAQKDEIATDAHWGAEMTYDYLFQRYNRNSIDNNGFTLRSYVHYDVNYANAFWDGQRMTFGDGNSTFNPLVAIDIVAHEISHGLTSYTADLDYSYESGALNEAYSDIFGTSVEFFAKPNDADWLMGEDIGSALRNMANPNSYGDPDTYHGTNWYFGSGDNGGVHTNSGVLNFWYYLLSHGGTGINDIGNPYNVTGIGIDTAGTIAYRTLSVYLTNTSQYIDARFYSIMSAIDLYGPCSVPVESVTSAMYAVGIGNLYVDSVIADFTADFNSFCTTPAVVNFTNQSNNGSSYYWDFGDGNNSTTVNPTHSYNSFGNYAVKLLTFGGACGTDSIIKAAYISIDPANPCTTMIPQNGSSTITTCFGTLYDSGGLGNYHDNTNSVTTINPAGAINVILNFTSFSFETGYDYLHIYDGPNTSSTLIGSYDGNSLPNGGTIVSTGSSITLRQDTDQGVTEPGFSLNWSCNYPNAAPFTDFDFSDTTSCSGEIQFFDKSLNGPTNWLWYFGDGDTSSFQNPMHNYTANGTYNVKLVASNAFGSDSIIKSNIITINRPNAPLSQSIAKCDTASFTFNASASGTVFWYDDPNSSIFIDTGNIFITPVLTTTTHYYIENVEGSSAIYGGKSNNTGGGGFFTSNSSHYLVFDCYVPTVIKSVLVYASNTGNRDIELRGSSGNVIQSKTINIPIGSSRINLDFNVPAGTGFRLAGPVSPNLYRNNNGTNYPYAIGNLINITHSSASSNPTGYYYYFYDWEVLEPACISPRIQLTAFVHFDGPTADFTHSNTDPTVDFYDASLDAAFYHWDFGDGDTSNLQNPSHTYTSNGNFAVQLTAINGCDSDTISKTVKIGSTGIDETSNLKDLNIYPNPTEGLFTINFSSPKQQKIEMNIIDILGNIIRKEIWSVNIGDITKTVDISSLAKGLYMINILSSSGLTSKKVVLR